MTEDELSNVIIKLSRPQPTQRRVQPLAGRPRRTHSESLLRGLRKPHVHSYWCVTAIERSGDPTSFCSRLVREKKTFRSRAGERLNAALAMKVHTKLGAGLLESVYQKCLFYELRKAGFKVEKEKSYSLIYEELRIDCGFRADLVVENKVIVECKCVELLNNVHKAQLLTYLRLADCKLGLLFNFKTLQLKNGIKRVVNGL